MGGYLVCVLTFCVPSRIELTSRDPNNQAYYYVGMSAYPLIAVARDLAILHSSS